MNFKQLEELAKRIIKQKNIEKYISCIEENNYPAYNIITKKLKLNTDMYEYWIMCVEEDYIKEYIPYVGGRLKEINLSNNFYDLLFIFVALHEIRHAEQKKILIEDYKNYDTRFLKTLLYSSIKENFKHDHDKEYYEYDANITAIKEINELNKIYKFSEYHEFARYMAYKILYAYGNLDNNKLSNPLKNNVTNEFETIMNYIKYDVYYDTKDCHNYLLNNDLYMNQNSIIIGSETNQIKKIIKVYKGE